MFVRRDVVPDEAVTVGFTLLGDRSDLFDMWTMFHLGFSQFEFPFHRNHECQVLTCVLFQEYDHLVFFLQSFSLNSTQLVVSAIVFNHAHMISCQ